MPVLIPGVGAQQGPLELAVSHGVDGSGRNAIVNASRGVIYASKNTGDFEQAARKKAEEVRDFINHRLVFQNQGWPTTAPVSSL